MTTEFTCSWQEMRGYRSLSEEVQEIAGETSELTEQITSHGLKRINDLLPKNIKLSNDIFGQDIIHSEKHRDRKSILAASKIIREFFEEEFWRMAFHVKEQLTKNNKEESFPW